VKCVLHPLKILMSGCVLVAMLLVASISQANADSKVDAALLRLLNIESSSLPRVDKVMPGETAKGRYRIRSGDTLDGIIMRFYGDSSLQKKILRDAFVKGNPQSFRRNNANWMLAGTVLRLPDRDAVYNVVFKGDATSRRSAADKSGWIKFPR
jgi:Tfp pilus assembly protein FimV